MARYRNQDDNYLRPLRRIALGLAILFLFLLFIVWRIDNPRVERLRSAVIERVVPNVDWMLVPFTRLAKMTEGFQSYARLYEQNQQLRRELQQMKAWREAAQQLERENARLLDLNNVRLSPEFTFVTGVVTADSGSPFRRSVILNIGRRDGVRDGWATMDGLGLVGRIAGTSDRTARVLLLTDPASHIPVTLPRSGGVALLVGDNTNAPLLQFVEGADQIQPGDRVVTSGDGGLFPSGILVGQVALDRDRRLRVRLAADYRRLEFLRVIRTLPQPDITEALPVGPAADLLGAIE